MTPPLSSDTFPEEPAPVAEPTATEAAAAPAPAAASAPSRPPRQNRRARDDRRPRDGRRRHALRNAALPGEPIDALRAIPVPPDDPDPTLVTLAESQHPLRPEMILPEARRVLERLNAFGYTAYLCGGGVRDLWLGKTPKDFDVVTNARPEQVRRVFRNCRVIGRRFRLAHVIFGDTIIETATFRALQDTLPDDAETVPVPSRRNHDIPDPTFATRDGVIVRDNQYGTPQQDARRRDFTVNGLFYDLRTRRILDYVGGIPDLQARILRVIGDPPVRYHEDPVRMVRAVRISAQLDFAIEPTAEAAIRACAPELANASHERMHEEMLKIFNCGHAADVFRRAWDLGLFQVIYPEFSDFLRAHSSACQNALRALAQFDIWKQNGLRPAPALQYALLFGPCIETLAASRAGNLPLFEATMQAVSAVIRSPGQLVLIPKSILFDVERIMGMQIQMAKSTPASRYGARLRTRSDFPDALVYLKFATAAHPDRKPLLDSWI